MGASLAKCLANLIGIWFDRSKEQRNNAIFNLNFISNFRLSA